MPLASAVEGEKRTSVLVYRPHLGNPGVMQNAPLLYLPFFWYCFVSEKDVKVDKIMTTI